MSNRKKRQRIICLIMALLMLMGSFPTTALAKKWTGEDAQMERKVLRIGEDGQLQELRETPDPEPTEYGPFKNVKHTIRLDDGAEELCQRHLTGELTFDWPEPTTYFDVVFVQDMSGSFAVTIDDAGRAVNQIIDNLNMGTEANGYPKDRVMFTTFKGNEGRRAEVGNPQGDVDVDIWYGYTYNNYLIGGKELSSNKADVKSWVTATYDSEHTEGGTPTVDGLAEAEIRYKNAISDGAPYNKASYQVDGKTRTRKTIYILITDGAANTAKWRYLSDRAKSALIGRTDEELTYYHKDVYRTGTWWWRYYPWSPEHEVWTNRIYYTVDATDVPLLWTDSTKGDDGKYSWADGSRTEAYGAMLLGLEDLASEIRLSGGVGTGGTTNYGEATVVTAFWEDTKLLQSSPGYTTNWANMSPKVKASLQRMAGTKDHSNDPDLFVTSNTDIEDFNRKLSLAFRKASTEEVDRIELKPDSGLKGKSFSLYRKTGEFNGEPIYTLVKTGNESGLSMNIDMTNMEYGSYKIEYHVEESEFRNNGYVPTGIKMWFEGEAETIVDLAVESDDPNRGWIEVNTRQDCDIVPSKKAALKDFDRDEGVEFQELPTQRDYFYYKTNFVFTPKVQEATDSIVLRDKIDSRLDILDAHLIAMNDIAEEDAVSGATPQNSLIAEMKGVAGADGQTDHEDVEELIVEDNTVRYEMPEKEATVAGITLPYAGYDGAIYLLVVKVRLNENVTDAQIDEMHVNEPLYGEPYGIPNVTEILVDGEISSSNRVKALPPRTEPPEIQKYAAKEESPLVFQPIICPLDDVTDTFRYRLEVPLEEIETSGYNRLVIEDQLKEELQIVDLSQVTVQYGDKQLTGEITDTVEIAGDGTTTEGVAIEEDNGKIKVTITNKEHLKAMGKNPSQNEQQNPHDGKRLFVEFQVKIKDGADLFKYYNIETRKFEIRNTATVKVNELDPNTSDLVKVTVPVENVSIKKYDDVNQVGLKGAVFEIEDTTEDEDIIPQDTFTVTTDVNGEALIDRLNPNRTYKVTETKAPDGYVLDSETTWTIVVDNQGRATITKIKDGTAEQVEEIELGNTKPETPNIEKFLKGEGENAIFDKYGDGDADPYLMTGADEEITYKIKVPISDTSGYSELIIRDEIDANLLLDAASFEVKTYTGEEEGESISGNLTWEGKTFIWTKTSGFEELEGTDGIVIQFKGKVDPDKLKDIYDNQGGKIRNQASVELNGQGENPSNEVVSQLVRGKIELTKYIKENESAEGVLLPEGLFATFALYKVNGNPDAVDENGQVTPEDGDDNDIFIKTVHVNGSEGGVGIADYLDPGEYYLVETVAPIDYVRVNTRIPDSGTIEIPGDVQVPVFPQSAYNIKAQHPTVAKMVKGQTQSEYSGDDLVLSIGEEWTYAIDISIPENAEKKVYIAEDIIKEELNIAGNPTVLSDTKDFPGVFSEDDTAKGWLDIGADWTNNAKMIKLTIPEGNVAEYGGRTIRIVVPVAVKENTNLRDAEDLTPEGKFPNTVTLYKQSGENKEYLGDATVYVIPPILRPVEFKKVLGNDPLPGAQFTLYPRELEDPADIEVETIIERGAVENPLANDEDYEATSDSNGKVTFDNVPAGYYWLLETNTPEGTFLAYDKIQVTVNPNPSIGNTSKNAVTFHNPAGLELISTSTKGEIWNNEMVTVPVRKVWVGDEGLGTRPNGITVELWREGGGLQVAEKVAEAKLTDRNNWEYFFSTDLNVDVKDRLLKYGLSNNEPYTYFVKEVGDEAGNPLLIYDTTKKTTKEGLTEFTNTLKGGHTLRVIKLDGDSKKPIKGTTFVLEGPDGVRKRTTSDEDGILQVDGLMSGVEYKFWEERTEVSEPYIVNTGVVLISFDENGQIEFTPNRYEYDEENRGYIFLNYKKTKPTKKVNNLDEYTLENYADEVTYTIDVPIRGTGDINQIVVEDYLDQVLRFIPNSAEIEVIREGADPINVRDYFSVNVTDGQRRVIFRFVNSAQNEVLDFENSTLRFRFKAGLSVSPTDLGRLHPNGEIPNKASLTINNQERNRTESNVVTIDLGYHTLEIQKTLEQPNGDPVNADINKQATFDLYIKGGNYWDDAEDRPDDDLDDISVGKFTTDAYGKITIKNLLKSEYRLVESKVPEGYLPTTKEFTIDDDTTQTFGLEIENELMDFPQVHKRVKGIDQGMDALEEAYEMADWTEEFTYVVDVPVPIDCKSKRIQIEDTLPNGIVVDDDSKVNVEVWNGHEGDPEFAKDETGTENLKTLGFSPKITVNDDGRTVMSLDSKDFEGTDLTMEALRNYMRGKTMRFIYQAHLKEGYDEMSDFHTDEDGYIVNTVTLTMNGEFEFTDSAKVKPTPRYGAELKKVVKVEGQTYPAYDARFKLEQYLGTEGDPTDPEGPAIPEDIQMNLVSGEDGKFTIPDTLYAGKYILKEIGLPDGYMKETQQRPGQFAAIYDHYVLEVGENEEGQSTIQLWGYTTPDRTDEGTEITPVEGVFELENRELRDVTVKKDWVDNDNRLQTRPDEITLTLIRQKYDENAETPGYIKDNEFEGITRVITVPAGESFTYTFTSDIDGTEPLIYKYDENGNAYHYTVEETMDEEHSAYYNGTVTEFDDSAEPNLKLTNTMKTQEFRILKVDGSDNAPLSGVPFSISYTKDNRTIAKTLETSEGPNPEKGMIVIDYLAANMVYKLYEIEAPAGYQKDSTVYTIVTDGEANPTVYTQYDGPGASTNVEATVSVEDATDTTPSITTLTIENNGPEVPIPIKTVNDKPNDTIDKLDDTFNYEIVVPVNSVEGMDTFVIKDTPHEYLEIQGNTIKVETNRGTVLYDSENPESNKDGTNLVTTENSLEFTMGTIDGKNFDFKQIEGQDVIVTYQAKIKEGTSFEQLKELVTETNPGVPNTAQVKVNNNPSQETHTYLIPGDPGKDPVMTKKVNDSTHYDLKTPNEVVHYEVKVDVDDIILGYSSLVITDTMADVLELKDNAVTVSIQDYDNYGNPLESVELALTTDYTLTTPSEGSNEITVTLNNNFDYNRAAGKSIVLSFDAKIKDDIAEEDLDDYKVSGKILVPNTAKIKFNDKEKEPVEVTITPPTDPTINKQVKDGEEYKDEASLSDGQMTGAEKIPYRITATVPYNVTGMETFVIKDVLNEALMLEDGTGNVTVYVDDAQDSLGKIVLAYEATTRTLTAKISGNDNIEKYAGKTIQLDVSAKINPNKDLRQYLDDDEKLPNTAELLINGDPKVSDTAKVTPKAVTIKIQKNFEGLNADTDAWPEGKTAIFELQRKDSAGNWVKVGDDIVIDSFEAVEVEGLFPGNYRLEETQAPDGFRKGEPVEFVIPAASEEGQSFEDQTITVMNYKDTLEKTAKDYFENFDDTVEFTITVPVSSVDGITSFVIEDTLDDYFELDGEITTTLVSEDDSEATLTPGASLAGKKIKLEITEQDKITQLADKTVKITYSVKLKDDFKYEDLPDDYKKNGIPNEAKLIVNNNPNPSTVKERVKVPVGEVKLTKTADGNKLPAGTVAKFDLYKKVEGTDGKKLIGHYMTDDNDQIIVDGLDAGDYYFIETVAPSGYVLNETHREFTVTVDDTGKAIVEQGEGFGENFTVNNTTSSTPKPEKSVKEEGEDEFMDNLVLSAFTKTFSYKVEVPIEKVDGWETFKLTDQVDEHLTVSNSKIEMLTEDGVVADIFVENSEVTEGYSTVASFEIDENNLLTFTFTGMDQVTAWVGKTIVLTFDAQIEDVEAYLAAHPEGVVGNTAEVDVGNGPKESNEVIVAQPTKPLKTIDSDAQGNTSTPETTKKLGSSKQEFTYDVRVPVPSKSAEEMTSFVISDKLEPVLETDETKIQVYVNDSLDLSLKDFVEYDEDTNKVQLSIKDTDEGGPAALQKIAGKMVRLEIKAKFVENPNLSDYAENNNRVPNTAELSINNTAPISSNTVNVTPAEKPEVEKTVEVEDGEPLEDILLDSKGQVFIYKVKTKLDLDVDNNDTLILEDTLEDVLEIDNAGIEVLLNDVRNDTLTEKIDQVGNKVSLTITGNLTDYENQTITLVIPATIKESVTTDQIAQRYGNSAIPNEAKLTFNNDVRISKKVTVTPPGEEPTPVKRVNGQMDATLTGVQDEFVYNISYKIPTNVTGFNQLLLTDILDKALEVVEISDDEYKVKVYADEKANDALTTLVKVVQNEDNAAQQEITLHLKQKNLDAPLEGQNIDFTDYAGQTIRVEIFAKIKDGADLSAYPEGKIPNTASLQLNDHQANETDKVYVSVPKGGVILTKTVDGSLLSGDQEATFKLYKQAGETPKPDTDYVFDEIFKANAENKSQIIVSDLEQGHYYFVEETAPEGYTVDKSPIPFEITRDQKTAVALTFNNVSELTPTKTVDYEESVDVTDYSKPVTFRITVPVGSTGAMTEFKIEDEVNGLLTIDQDSIRVYTHDGTTLAKNSDDGPNKNHIDVTGQKITYTRKADFKALTNKSVTLEFKATIDKDINVDQVKDYMGEDGTGSGIPNTATLTLNNNSSTKKETKEVYVRPLLGALELTKTVDNEPLSGELFAKFKLYKQTGIAPIPTDPVIGEYKVDAEESTISVSDLIPGKYFFVETEAPEGYKLTTKPVEFTIIGGATNTEKITVDNAAADIPTPHKEVSKDTVKKDEPFTYTLSYDVPENLSGIESIQLIDKLDKVLITETDKSGITVYVGEEARDDLKVNVSVTPIVAEGVDQGKTEVKLALDQEILSTLKGETIKMTIEAKIKADADLTGYVDNTIPNKATLTINNDQGREKVTDDVPVKLDGTVDIPVEKKWSEGSEELSYVELYVVTDSEDEKEDAVRTHRLFKADSGEWKYTFKNLPKYDEAGMEIDYYVKEVIPDGYTAKITPEGAYTEGTVTITNTQIIPPGESPIIDKTVENVKSYQLTGLYDEFTYTITTAIDDNISDYKELVITDELEDVLQVTNVSIMAGTIDIKNDISTYSDSDENSFDNHFKLVIDKGFDELKGKDIVITIKAKIKDDVTISDLEAYLDTGIPNTANLEFTNESGEVVNKESSANVDLPDLRNFELHKTWVGGAGIAKFEFFRKSNGVETPVTITEDQFTVPEGIADFEGNVITVMGDAKVVIKGLPMRDELGKFYEYYMEEVSPTGYVSEQSLLPCGQTFVNIKDTYQVVLLKTDKDTGRLLEGAEFKLYKKVEEGVFRIPVSLEFAEGTDYDDDVIAKLYKDDVEVKTTTLNNEKLTDTFSNLEAGSYRLEVDPIEGYTTDITLKEGGFVITLTVNSEDSGMSEEDSTDIESLRWELNAVDNELYELNGALEEVQQQVSDAEAFNATVAGNQEMATAEESMIDPIDMTALAENSGALQARIGELTAERNRILGEIDYAEQAGQGQEQAQEQTAVVSETLVLEDENSEASINRMSLSGTREAEEYEKIGDTWTTDENGAIAIDGLEPGEYYFKEITAPDGYQLPDDEDNQFEFTVPETDDEEKPIIVRVENEREKEEVTFYKVWYDMEGNPITWPEGIALDITVTIDGVAYTVPVYETGQAGVTIEGGKIKLTGEVAQATAPSGESGYKITVQLPHADELILRERIIKGESEDDYWPIDGRYEISTASGDPLVFYNGPLGRGGGGPETRTVKITKKWQDADGNPIAWPSGKTAQVQLLANGAAAEDVDGNPVPTISLTKDNPSYTFTNLPKSNGSGTITYTVKELPSSEYSVGIAGDMDTGFTITNKLKAETPPIPSDTTVKVEGTKTWVGDNPADRPSSIKVILKQNGEVLMSKTVSASDGWKYSFEDLPAKDGSGVAYIYTVTEVIPEGYSASYSGYNIINTKKPDEPDEPSKPGKPSKPSKPSKPGTPSGKPNDSKIPQIPKAGVAGTRNQSVDSSWRTVFCKDLILDDRKNRFGKLVSGR